MDFGAPAVSDLDHRLISEEIEANPSFGKQIAAVIDRPGGARAVSLSAKKAIANEFDSRLYPETRGQWTKLRRRAHDLARALPDIVEKEIDRLPFATKMEMVRRIARGEHPTIAFGIEGMGELGQFEIIGSILSSVAGAASSIYGARVTASAQKDIAKIQAETAMKDLNTQMALANAQTAINQAKVAQAQEEAKKIEAQTAQIKAQTVQTQEQIKQAEVGTVVGTLTKDIGGGVPLWVLPMALGVLGLVLYFVFKKR